MKKGISPPRGSQGLGKLECAPAPGEGSPGSLTGHFGLLCCVFFSVSYFLFLLRGWGREFICSSSLCEMITNPLLSTLQSNFFPVILLSSLLIVSFFDSLICFLGGGLVAQLRTQLCDPMDRSQASLSMGFSRKSTEWVAISSSRGSSRPQD